MRALVFANGELGAPGAVRLRLTSAPYDLVICADGGVLHAHALGVRPDVVVGDLDSLPEAVQGALRRAGVPLCGYPARKDETDLELALLYAATRGATEAIVIGACGGRLDHELGNLLLLAHPRLSRMRVYFVYGDQEITLVTDRVEFHGEVGDLLSLLPIGGDAHGVRTDGLEYPLRGETLFFGPARGVSNVFAVPNPTVSLTSGQVIAVHTRRFPDGSQT